MKARGLRELVRVLLRVGCWAGQCRVCTAALVGWRRSTDRRLSWPGGLQLFPQPRHQARALPPLSSGEALCSHRVRRGGRRPGTDCSVSCSASSKQSKLAVVLGWEFFSSVTLRPFKLQGMFTVHGVTGRLLSSQISCAIKLTNHFIFCLPF